MKARRMALSALTPQPVRAIVKYSVQGDGDGIERTHDALSDLDWRILGELKNVFNSRSSQKLAKAVKANRYMVDAGFQRLLALGLVRRPKNSREGVTITEAGRAAWGATIQLA